MQIIYTDCLDVPGFKGAMDDSAVQRALEDASKCCWRLTMAIAESTLEAGGDLMCIPSDTGVCAITFVIGNETSNAHLGQLHRSGSHVRRPCEWPMCRVELAFRGE